MNDPNPIDENEFAERLEQVEIAAKKQESIDAEALNLENAAQHQEFEAAARMIGMIHRVRKSRDPAGLETAGQNLDTPQQPGRSGPAEATQPDISDSEHSDNDSPHTIGRFEIRRQLGQGGYGLVYLAYDPQLDREVALKVPRPEAFADSSMRTRFLREAKAAGGLNHANIVPVFEAGHVGPICYIATAYCPGPTLSQWVLDSKLPITPAQATEWLMTLADAVQHAHLRRIIHRDLKPDNILVDLGNETAKEDGAGTSAGHPTLRITDFGLAKDLGDTSNLTQSGSVVGTPAFISPEQTGKGFGTPSHILDIYGLGAILYFILCRVPPIAGDSLLDTISKVQEQTPAPLRRIRPDVPADLEAICLKCLEKQPRNRYQSASELHGDLLRFRDGLPVQARRPSRLDRGLMWCRRRPAVAALAAALLGVLATSSIALGILLVRTQSLKTISDQNATRATASAATAQTERNRTRDALQAMTSGVATDWLGGQSELTGQQKAFLTSTIDYYREFAAGSTEDPEDQLWVATAEHRLAELFFRLGQLEDALASNERAINLLEQIPADYEPVTVSFELADTLHDYESIIFKMGRADEALPIAKRAVEIARSLVAANPDGFRSRNLLAETVGNLGSRLRQLRRMEEALAAQTESVLIKEKLVQERPDDEKSKRSLGISYMNLGNLLTGLGQPRQAQERLEQARKIRAELVESRPESAIFQFDLAMVLNNLAGLAFRTRQIKEAESWSEQGVAISRTLVSQHPMVERYRNQLVSGLGNFSVICNTSRKFEKSEKAIAEMNTIAERSVRDFPDVPLYRLQLANGKSSMATVLTEQGQRDEAMEFHDAAIAGLRELIEQSIEVNRATRLLESALYNRATALGELDRHRDAMADWDAAIEVTPENRVNTIWLCRATTLVKLGQTDDAVADMERILAETMKAPKEKRDFRIFYNSACIHSLISSQIDDEDKKREQAMKAIQLLQQAVDAGLPSLEYVRSDPELEPLHKYSEFQAIVKE